MPIVVAIQQSRRAALRKGGGAPEGFFCEKERFDSDGARALLWPHDLDYEAGKGETWVNRQVDLGAFFGLGRAKTEEERRANEERLDPLFQNPLVCVVFLGGNDGKDASGYARFQTFEGISNWIQRFDKAILKRYSSAERNIWNVARSLVVVVEKGQRIHASKKDVTVFEKHIGVNRQSRDEGSFFTSCYFLNYNLGIGTGTPFFAHDVWPVMVGRLLIAFELSSESGDGCKPLYAQPGIKVWRSLDCFASEKDGDALWDTEKTKNEIASQLRFQSSPNDDEEINKGYAAKSPSAESLLKGLNTELEKRGKPSAKEEEWRQEPKSGWSDFDSLKCLAMTRDEKGDRWPSVFQDWKTRFLEWHREKRLAVAGEINEEIGGGYRKVHLSAANVFLQVRALEMRDFLARQEKREGKDNLVAHLKTAAEREKERVGWLGKLAADAPEFERARRRYVGNWLGVCAFLSVAMALGLAGFWMVHLAARLFGVSDARALLWELVVSFCVAGGSLAAFVVTICRHSQAGKKGMNELIKFSKAADEAMEQKDKTARSIVTDGMASDLARLLWAARFRSKVLLTRLQTMLITEMCPEVSSGKATEEETVVKTSSKEHSEEDKCLAFLHETRKEVNLDSVKSRQMVSSKNIKKEVAEWLGKGAFAQAWRELSKEDKKDAGNYPARKAIPILREVVTNFMETVQEKFLKTAGARDTAQADLVQAPDEFKDWVEHNASGYQYASSALDGVVVNERMTPTPLIYYRSNMIADQPEVNLINGKPRFQKSDNRRNGIGNILKKTKLLALLYNEYRVSFCVDNEEFLQLKEASR